MSALLEPLAAPPKAGPRPRTLALLLIAVLMAHVLVLRTAPTRFGPKLDPTARRAPAFTTRSIKPPPAPETGAPPLAAPTPPAPKPAAKPAPKPAKKPVSRSNSPLVPNPSAPAAIE